MTPNRPDDRRATPPEAADFAPFAVTVDIVFMTILGGDLRVLLVQRGSPPYRWRWALPGGLVMKSEPLGEAALRIARTESGILHRPRHMEQLGAYGAPGRDPRARVVTVAYWAVAQLPGPPQPERAPAPVPRPSRRGSAVYAEFVPAPEIESGRLRLAFDHPRIVADALEELRSRLETTTLARRFCPPEFTIAQLREVYEAVWGTPLDAANFQRKVLGSPGFVAPLEKWRRPDGRGGRPARLWEAENDLHRLRRPFPPLWRAKE